MDTSLPQSGPRLRPRFSLLTVLLLMALVACGITIWQLWREVGPLRAEVRKLRDEVGALWIDDEAKVHAIQAATGESLSWKWRVWVPDAAGAIVHFKIGGIPRDGFPTESHQMALEEAGEGVITMTIRRDPVSNEWVCRAATSSMSMLSPIPEADQWFTADQIGSKGEAVGSSTRVFDKTEKTIVLMRHRVSLVADAPDMKTSNDLLNGRDPLPGFIIWLERR